MQTQTQVLERLSNLFSLTHFVEITLPSTVEIDQAADNATLIRVYEHVLTCLSEVFGGATITQGRGAWYSSELGKIVFEDVQIVKSYAEQLGQPEITRVIDLAQYVKAELSQESVLIVLDGIAYLV